MLAERRLRQLIPLNIVADAYYVIMHTVFAQTGHLSVAKAKEYQYGGKRYPGDITIPDWLL